MKNQSYTVKIYKIDRRLKKGEKLVSIADFTDRTLESLELEYSAWLYTTKGAAEGNPIYRYEINETYVTRTSAMSGEEFQERYDTPYYCSPSSETYWSS